MKWHRILKSTSGTAAVEFALVLPFLLLVLLSIIAYGIYLTASHAIQQVAADAARSAVAGYNLTERKKLAQDYVDRSTLDYAFLDPSAVKVVLTDDKSNSNQFTVTIQYDAQALPIWGLYTYMLPRKTISKFSTIRVGGT